MLASRLQRESYIEAPLWMAVYKTMELQKSFKANKNLKKEDLRMIILALPARQISSRLQIDDLTPSRRRKEYPFLYDDLSQMFLTSILTSGYKKTRDTGGRPSKTKTPQSFPHSS